MQETVNCYKNPVVCKCLLEAKNMEEKKKLKVKE